MILIITTSIDRTADMIVERLQEERFFRFNADLLADYRVEFTPGIFRLCDPLGREVLSDKVTACYFRKLDWPYVIDTPAGGSVESWIRKNQAHFAHELYDWFRGSDRIVMEIGARYPMRKIRQMNLAARFFPVPEYFAGISPKIHELTFADRAVSKNMVDAFIVNFKGHHVSAVDSRALDPAFPWFLQERVEATADITVAYVNGRIFPYACPRKAGDVDCRTLENLAQWRPASLSESEADAVIAFMREAGLNFGRLDFLRGNDGRLHFLEVNSNGQWGWLDLNGDNGLLDAIVAEILAVHQKNTGQRS